MSYAKAFKFPCISSLHNFNASFSCVGFIFNMAILSSLGISIPFLFFLLFFFLLSSSLLVASALISFFISALFLHHYDVEERKKKQENAKHGVSLVIFSERVRCGGGFGKSC